jgi:hypothetical protein
MVKFLSVLAILCVSFFFSNQAVAGMRYDINPENYIYNHEGTPLFVKVYVGKNALFIHQGKESLFLLKLMQKDRNGSFLPVPISKKHKPKKEDDEEEDTWVCPYCETVNSASAGSCTNPDCVLYRTGGRNW